MYVHDNWSLVPTESIGVSSLKTNNVKEFLMKKWCQPHLSITRLDNGNREGNRGEWVNVWERKEKRQTKGERDYLSLLCTLQEVLQPENRWYRNGPCHVSTSVTCPVSQHKRSLTSSQLMSHRHSISFILRIKLQWEPCTGNTNTHMYIHTLSLSLSPSLPSAPAKWSATHQCHITSFYLPCHCACAEEIGGLETLSTSTTPQLPTALSMCGAKSQWTSEKVAQFLSRHF